METEKILEQQVLKLPRKVTKFLASTDWATSLETIAVSYALTTDERAQFKNETVLVLAGLVHPDAYTETLGAVLGVNPTLTNIVAEVEKTVFAPIRPELVKFFADERAHSGEQEVAEKQSTPEIPSPWTISDAAEPEKISAKTPPLAPPTPKQPPLAPKENLIPTNLPTPQEESVWAPKISMNTPAAQPLPQMFNPLGKKTTTETDTAFVHPFEQSMKNAFMERTSSTLPPQTTLETVSVPRYGTPGSIPQKPVMPMAETQRGGAFKAPQSSIPLAPQNSFGGVVAAPQVATGGDPYREPIE